MVGYGCVGAWHVGPMDCKAQFSKGHGRGPEEQACIARVRWDTITSLLRVVWLILSAKSRGVPAKFRQLPPCFGALLLAGLPLFLLELPPFPQMVRPFANGYAFYRRRYALCRWFAFFSQGFPRATPPHALTEGRGHFGMRVGDEYASLGGCWG